MGRGNPYAGQPRYPWVDLVAAMGCSENQAIRQLGVSGSSLKAARTLGLVPKAADRLAVKAGLHPASVWPSWVDDGIAMASRACDECSTPFLPRTRTHRFCRSECGRRFNARVQARRQRSTPEGAARNAEKVRAWRAGLSPAARRAQQAKQQVRSKAWYEAHKAEQQARSAARRKARYASDEVYRQRVLAKQRVRDRAKAAARRAELEKREDAA